MEAEESPELRELSNVSEGLEYPSESDAPFELFQWPGRGVTALEQVAAQGGAGRKIEEVPVEQFFKELADSEDAERFGELRKCLESQLAGVKVFRVGVDETEVDIFLMGLAKSGDWMGLHTISVET